MIKNIAILGSTGSIGRNVLEVVRQFPERFRVVGLAAGNNIALLREQLEAFNPSLISVADAALAGELAQSLPASWSGKIVAGVEGNKQVATMPEADTVVSAIVGAAGLVPTVAAVEAGKDLALANKETLVMAGELVLESVRRRRINLLPVDSEHNAIAQALEAGRREDVSRLLLTASGGPFRTKTVEELWRVTPEEALNHPNWEMGKKITIDSATLMNKGLEVIEARWLFDIPVEQIEVLIHPQSIVHSMVEFIDGSVVAQLGIPDMRIPIAYALSYPERLPLSLPRLELAQARDLSFLAPDWQLFPALKLAYQVCKQGGTLPAVLNAANEVAVEAFLEGKIRFPEIALVAAETVSKLPRLETIDVNAVLEADLEARDQAQAIVEALFAKARQGREEEAGPPDLPPRFDSIFRQLSGS